MAYATRWDELRVPCFWAARASDLRSREVPRRPQVVRPPRLPARFNTQWATMAHSQTAISLDLIDPSDGRSLQSWNFSTERVTIGRGDEMDIALADPYVSRLHAELVRTDGTWYLQPRGRNGVYVEGKSSGELALRQGTTFRLGPQGPIFRFGNAPATKVLSTLTFDAESLVVLALNRQEVEVQAQEIMATDYFQQLQQQARQMRRRRPDTP